jgi:hypothetical protein
MPAQSNRMTLAFSGAGEYTVADFTIPPEPNPIKLPVGRVDQNSVAPSK